RGAGGRGDDGRGARRPPAAPPGAEPGRSRRGAAPAKLTEAQTVPPRSAMVPAPILCNQTLTRLGHPEWATRYGQQGDSIRMTARHEGILPGSLDDLIEVVGASHWSTRMAALERETGRS